MFCGKCGTKVNDSASYCPKCGEKLKRASAPVQSQVTSPPSQGIKTEHRYRGIITIVVVCLALIALIAVISSTSNGYYRQVLGEWYLQGESDPVFTLYKDKSCLVANSDVGDIGQESFFAGMWSLVGGGFGSRAGSGSKLSLSAPGMEPWNAYIIKIDDEKMIVGQWGGADVDDPDNMILWRFPHY